MRFIRLLLLLAAVLASPHASAAVVTYGLDLSVPGEFQIFASASLGDNYGISTYGLPLTAETTAMITSHEHVSPANYATDATGVAFGSAGFTQLRGEYMWGGLTFAAGQGFDSTTHIIRGFGQSAGSYAGLGLTPVSTDGQSSWGDMLLLARGTYQGDAADFHLDTNRNTLLANVFTGPTGRDVMAAEVRVTGVNGFTYTPRQPTIIPPEPDPIVTPPIVTPDPDPVTPPIITPPPRRPIAPPRYTDGTRPVVTYNMDLTVPGEFKIFASASAGDNFGISTYGLPLTAETAAMLTSYEHVSPNAMATDSDGVFGPAGFTKFRSVDSDDFGGLTFVAAQEKFNPNWHVIQGLGQQAGSLTDLGLIPLTEGTHSWDSSILIAQGTYVGDPNDFTIDTSSHLLLANVITSADGMKAVAADVHVHGTNGFTYQPLPMQPVVDEPPPVTIEPPPIVIDPPTVTPPPVTEPIDELEPPTTNPAGDDLNELVEDERIDEPINWSILTFWHHRGWIDVLDPVGNPGDLVTDADVLGLPWYEATDVDSAGGLPFPMIADDRFLRPTIDEAMVRTLIGSRVTAFDADITEMLFALNGMNRTAPDANVPEPAFLALCGSAGIAFAGLFRRCRAEAA